MRQIITSHYRRAKEFYLKNERWLMSATLVGGFLLDYITFSTIEIGFAFTILSIYWALAGTTIAFMHLYDAQKISQRLRYARLFSPLVIQFTFGALLSASLIFYWFSGVFSVSWPLIIIIAILMIFNDTFRHHFIRPVVQLSVYLFVTISLLSLMFPFWFNSIATWTFVAASVVSIAIFAVYVRALMRHIDSFQSKRTSITISLTVIVVFMNVLYFTNIIPPIPLALREAGVYHSVRSVNHQYVVRGESESFLQKLLHGQTLHVEPGGRVYLYTAIFAPADITTTIVNRWQRYDPQKEEWITMATPALTITGGRKQGYKGYTWVTNTLPGKWRIYVENKRGQVLGKVSFAIERAQGNIPLQEYIK